MTDEQAVVNVPEVKEQRPKRDRVRGKKAGDAAAPSGADPANAPTTDSPTADGPASDAPKKAGRGKGAGKGPRPFGFRVLDSTDPSKVLTGPFELSWDSADGPLLLRSADDQQTFDSLASAAAAYDLWAVATALTTLRGRGIEVTVQVTSKIAGTVSPRDLLPLKEPKEKKPKAPKQEAPPAEPSAAPEAPAPAEKKEKANKKEGKGKKGDAPAVAAPAAAAPAPAAAAASDAPPAAAKPKVALRPVELGQIDSPGRLDYFLLEAAHFAASLGASEEVFKALTAARDAAHVGQKTAAARYIANTVSFRLRNGTPEEALRDLMAAVHSRADELGLSKPHATALLKALKA